MSEMAAEGAQLTELRKIYTENHPEVRRLEALLRALQQGQTDVSTSVQTVQTSEMAAVEAQLTGLRKIYTENHPEVRRLEALLRALQQGQPNDKPK
jgi:uncharacterized protein involved in exopolysaccharide biosynthesis